MREFISFLISPLPILYILLISALVLRIFKKMKPAKIAALLSICWLLIISSRPIPYIIANSLEKRYRQLSDDEIKRIPDSVNIIVLGAGHTDDEDLAPNNQLNHYALSRLSEGIRLQKKIPGSKLILSGFGYRTDLPGAVVLYRTALILGMDSASLELSDRPLTTYSEADQYLMKFGAEKKLVLVTSAIHMPRAAMLFRSKNINIIPAPADFQVRHPSQKFTWRWLPASDYIKLLEQSMHEYGGIIWFHIGGK
ncbi:MAG TPA: ElyC/SanA/YdcF family protein [Bacteroidales bacterium]|nr:ElyC/SanA/YdcF family protein [Bacteroidales bacterium]